MHSGHTERFMFWGLCITYLAVQSFPEPEQFVLSELWVWQVQSPVHWSSEWPHCWRLLVPGGPDSPDAGLVVTSGGLKVFSEDGAGALETPILVGSLICFNKAGSCFSRRYSSEQGNSYTWNCNSPLEDVSWQITLPLSPGSTKEVFIILVIPAYPGDISQRGHQTILPPGAK